jgi:hypothetical protein
MLRGWVRIPIEMKVMKVTVETKRLMSALAGTTRIIERRARSVVLEADGYTSAERSADGFTATERCADHGDLRLAEVRQLWLRA